MTPWHLRERLHRWLILKLTGLDLAGADAAIASDLEPAPPSDRVVPVTDDSPFLGDEASPLLAKPRPRPAPPADASSLAGSVEERVARTRPRW